MNYDFLLLTPLFVAVGIYYWDLFKWGQELETDEWMDGLQEWEFENTVALHEDLSDNIGIVRDASNHSNQIPLHLHKETDLER